MAYIEPCLIRPEYRNQIGIDGGSWGIRFKIERPDGKESTRSEYIELIDLIKEIKLNGMTIYHSIASDPENPTVIFYDNKINGNRLLRTFVEEKFCFDLLKCRSTHVTAKENDNFLPVKARIDRRVARIIEKLYDYQVLLIFEELMDRKRKIDAKIRSKILATPWIVKEQDFVIGSIELNLDIVSPAGIDFGEDQEIALRLSRMLAFSRRGRFIEAQGENALVPNRIAGGLQFARIFDCEIVCGVTGLYGQLSDHTEMMVSCKEKPHPPASHVEKDESAFWLQRFEWRINRSVRLSNASDYLRAVLGTNSFSNLDELVERIESLKEKYFEALRGSLNVPFQLSGDGVQQLAGCLIDTYHSDHSLNVKKNF